MKIHKILYVHSDSWSENKFYSEAWSMGYFVSGLWSMGLALGCSPSRITSRSTRVGSERSIPFKPRFVL